MNREQKIITAKEPHPSLFGIYGHGINYEVVRTWSGNRKLERKLKNRKKSSILCPICQKERNGKPAKTIGKHLTTKDTLERKVNNARDI